MDAFDKLDPTELDRVLPHLFAAPHETDESAARVRSGFHEYIADGALCWEGLRCGGPDRPTGLFLAILMPGSTAVAMIPEPGRRGIDAAAQEHITAAGLAGLRSRNLHYVQALLEPRAAQTRALLTRVGFQPLAPLLYLEREARYPWVDPPGSDEATWLAYGTETHHTFADVVLATYEDSRDCPELSGLRPIDDVLAAHRASGRFDPQLWEVARINGQDAGCLLLNRMARGALLEVVYMGVVPARRRAGVGKLLLRRALHQCRTRSVRRLTVVVDGRNTPARRLYDGFAFKPVARRDAYVYRWR